MHVPQTEVILRHGDAELTRVTLPPGDYVIGRNADVEICADTPLISRRHAQLTINYDHLLIEDLGSSNGTFVNEQPIAEATRLYPNQPVRLGDITVEIRRHRAPSEPGVSLMPSQAAIRRFLPEEILAEKRYAIGSELARGGMGAILDARQTTIDRTVAMKVMLGSGAEGDVLRFIDEAKITGQLDHPNIVPIYELGVDEQDQLFYTMKLVHGITLKKVLELLAQSDPETVKKFPLPALLTVFQKVCDAVAFAHSRGVIHRDLKPENIMLGDFGSVLVMDWGLAKVMAKNESPFVGVTRGSVMSLRTSAPDIGSTMTGDILGTPQYMAPEQARGDVENLDARADIYALGAILFDILHLRPTVTGEDAMEVVAKVERGEIAWDAKRQARVPEGLLAVCRQALAHDKGQRYASVEDLQRDLTAYQTGFATSAERASFGKQLLLAVRRNKAASLGVAAVLLVGSVLGTKAIVEGQRAAREAVRANHALAELRKSAPTLLALAESEASFQRFDSALAKLDTALQLDPALTAGWWRRVWLLLGMERYAEAAAAFRTAQQRDPGSHAADTFLPVLDAMAAAPDDATRFPPERTAVVFQQLMKAGASGELNALTKHLVFNAQQKLEMVRKRMDEWLGKGVGLARIQPDGTIEVRNLPGATENIGPLRGLPLGRLELNDTAVKSIEPLQGMPLTYLRLEGSPIVDLSPLRGMLLTGIDLRATQVSDLTPLHGMPLRWVRPIAPGIRDLSPLRGAPLEKIEVYKQPIVDFTPLRGAPLKEVWMMLCQCSNLSFLTDASGLETLYCAGNSIPDLTPLRDKPLKVLVANGNRIRDLRPLAGMPLVELTIGNNPITDYSPLLELRQLQKLHISDFKDLKGPIEVLRPHPSLQYIAVGGVSGAPLVYRPVAEFWAAFDVQAAGKK